MLITLVCLHFAGYSQLNVPVFGRINYLKGYQKELKGENISYMSALPDFATTALLTRCTDGRYVIEWETEAVPADFRGEYVYFAWVAAHSKNTSHGDRTFDLFVNDQKALEFKTYKDRSFKHWSFAGAGGEEVVFEYKTDDGAGDAHGYMYLKIPVRHVEKGRPVRIRVAGHAEDSRDWYMTFKYAFEEAIVLSPVSLLTVDNLQPVQVLATHFGNDANLKMTINDERSFQFTLKPGLNAFEITYPAVDTLTPIHIRALVKGKPAKEYTVMLKPVTSREIHLIHHSHYDVGYSHHQEEVINIHNRNISNALRYIDNTRDLPVEARYKWNIETTLAIENFLEVASAAEIEKLKEGIRTGSVGIGGFYANIMTGICQPEELFKLTLHARQLENEWNIRIPSVMIGDIPGVTWATIPALARSGIRYFSNGPNFVGAYPYDGDRVGNSNINWKDRPFWWVSPSGNEKILFWMAGKGYSSWHGFKAGEIASPRGKKRISAYMDELDKKAYPYEMVQWRYNIVADNGPTDSLVSAFVLDWNRKYKSPRIVLNTIDQMFAEFERRYGDRLPVFSGDLTPYWEDGAYSTALEMAMNRRNSEKLTSLGTLYSMKDDTPYPAAAFDQAWKQVLLWDEHTWGAYNSISDPDIPFVVSQWKYKQRYALRADSMISGIHDAVKPQPAQALKEKLDIFNTLSWERTEVITLNQEQSRKLVEIRDEGGKILPLQHLSDGKVAVRVTVPPLGSLRIELIRGEQAPLPVMPKSVKFLENEHCRLELNEQTGSIARLVLKSTGVDLVDRSKYSGLNEYLYVPGKDPAMVMTNEPVELRCKEQGPLFTTLEVSGKAPGCRSLTREITFFEGQPGIEIRNTIDKLPIREKESVHFAFPFHVTAPNMRYNTGWGGVFQPGVNQLPGSNQDYYSVQHWCDVSNQDAGVSLLVREACLVEPGALINEVPGKYGVKIWKTEPDTTPTLYSYVMNNYWHTNYKADQDGVVSFSYALVPHGLFKLAEVQKQGIAFNQPLIVLPASVGQDSRSLFRLSNQNILVTSIEKLEKGYQIRCFNGGGAPENFHIEWNKLQPSRMEMISQPGSIEVVSRDKQMFLPASGILELRVFEK